MVSSSNHISLNGKAQFLHVEKHVEKNQCGVFCSDTFEKNPWGDFS